MTRARTAAAAACLLLATLLATTVPVRHAAAQDLVASSQQRYARGVALYDAGRFADALVEFREALTLFDSPNVRLFLARSLRELGRLAEAHAELERTVREAGVQMRVTPRYGATRDAAAEELAQLAQRVGHVVVTAQGAPATARITVDTRAVPAAALGTSLPVTAGPVRVTLEAPGFEPAQAAVEVAPGATVPVALRLRPVVVVRAPARAPADRRQAWAATAVGMVGATGAGVLFGLATWRYQMLLARCDAARRCDPSLAPVRDEGVALQTAGYVSLALGIAGVVTGVVLHIVARPRAPAPRALRVAPAYGAGPDGVWLTF